jgi:hypothetical protein
VLLNERTQAVHDMDNELEVFQGVRHIPSLPFGPSRTITFISFLLFLIPAVFIFLGSIIAASSPAGIFRWSGISIMAGGVPALLLALATKYFSLWAIKAAPFSWYDNWSSELGELVLDKLGWIPIRIVDQLFSPVIGVAIVVCVVGIVLFALSFYVRNDAKKTLMPVSSSPAPAAPQKIEAQEKSPDPQQK